MEKLSKVWQRLDHRGGSMWQLVSGKLGVLEECQGHLWELLSPGDAMWRRRCVARGRRARS